MSDDRLFSSNNPIGRKWYFINIVLLAALTWGTKFVFINYIIPAAISPIFNTIAKVMLYFLYAVFILTFLSLIDRRLFDICTSRSSQGYATVSSILSLCIFFQAAAFYCELKHPEMMISEQLVYTIAAILGVVFFVIVIFLGFIRGRMTGLSYEEYKNKIKYGD